MSHVDIDNSQIVPSSVNEKLGQKVTFRCNTRGHTVWFFNTDESPPMTKLEETSNSLTVEVSYEKIGYYFCHNNYFKKYMFHSMGAKVSDIYFVAIAKLTVQGMSN